MLVKSVRVSLAVAVFGAGVFALVANNAAQAAKAEKASIEEIMEVNHSGKKSLTNKVKTAVKAGNWDEAAAPAKKMKDLAAALGSHPCPNGDANSWKKLCSKYAVDVAAIAAAVEKKDASAANAAIGKLTKSCKTCHEAHRE